MFLTIQMDLAVCVVVVVSCTVGQSGERERGVGGVGDGDIHRLKRLTATGVVRGDFNVVGVGRTLPTINIHVGGLVDEGRDLHRLEVARCP